MTTKIIGTEYGKTSVDEYAKVKGLRVVRPNADQLFIDVDSAKDLEAFEVYFPVLRERYPDAYAIITPSRNKAEGKHITVTVPGRVFSSVERCAFQAILGSDKMREILSMFEILDGDVDPTIFFEKL